VVGFVFSTEHNQSMNPSEEMEENLSVKGNKEYLALSKSFLVQLEHIMLIIREILIVNWDSE
jgi:ATP adenylyltransferase/5',5'''-P-1,P-4-tetraphosphate phosphorylase II